MLRICLWYLEFSISVMEEFKCNVPFDMHVICMCNDANRIEITSQIYQLFFKENLHCQSQTSILLQDSKLSQFLYFEFYNRNL